MEHREAPGNDDDIALRKQQVVILLFLYFCSLFRISLALAKVSESTSAVKRVVPILSTPRACPDVLSGW